MAKKKETEFDKLARLIKSEGDDIRAHMATKKNIADIREDIRGIKEELKEIKARLKALEEMVADHSGHSKEIDHALERIAVIERRLGIKMKSR